MVISVWFFQVYIFCPFWTIGKLAKKVKWNIPTKQFLEFIIFHGAEISISCIIINFILLPLMLSEGGEENSICHASAAPFNE